MAAQWRWQTLSDATGLPELIRILNTRLGQLTAWLSDFWFRFTNWGVVNLKDFGAVGDGVADDTAAILRWYAAIPDGGWGYVPNGAYRFTATLSFNRAVAILCDGPGAAFIPDVGALADGIVVNNTVSADLHRIRLSLVVLSDQTNCCRNALVLNRVHNADDLHLHVKAKATAAGVVMNGCLSNRRTLIVISVNQSYPYPAAMPVTDSLRLVFDTVNTKATQANDLNLLIEGGGNGVYIDDQHSFGNNVIRGVVELGSSGAPYTLYAKNVAGLCLLDLYGESGSASPVTLENCTEAAVGPAFRLFGQSLNLIGTCRHCRLDHVQTDSLTVDATCDRIEVGNLLYNLTGAGLITDPGGKIIFTGTVVNAANATTASSTGGPPTDGVNLFPNTNFERWPLGDAATPGGLTFVANTPTYVKCGAGLADTTRDFSRYCAKITTALSGDAPAMVLDWNVIAGEWITLFARIKVPSGQPNVTLRLWFNGGATVRTGETRTDKDTWVWIATSFLATSTFASAMAVLAPAAAGTFYCSHWGYSVGVRRPRRLWTPPGMVPTEVVIDGTSITAGAAAPVAAGGPRRIGDLHLNTAPAVGGVSYWRCTATGTPGTWVAEGSVGMIRAAALADLAALATTQTAGGAYTATEQAMLNAIKTDLTAIRTEINTLLANRRTAGEQA